jgi:hypothetical protein
MWMTKLELEIRLKRFEEHMEDKIRSMIWEQTGKQFEEHSDYIRGCDLAAQDAYSLASSAQDDVDMLKEKLEKKGINLSEDNYS